MEGITYPEYRRVHARMFPGAARYYTPFIAPDPSGCFRGAPLRGVLPENNAGVILVPQLLVNAAGPFLIAAQVLSDLGYTEVDLNVGCPSGTVTSKHKGAGMLRDPDALDHCLEEIFSRCPLAVSVKTRLGFDSTEEFSAVLAVYRKYPLSRLTVHARDRAGMYRSRPDLEAFASALKDSPFPVIYNGDLFTPGDIQAISLRFPCLYGAMLGRGAVCDPALFRRAQGGPVLRKEELNTFLETLTEEYLASGLAPAYTAARMKELWYYMRCLFPDAKRAVKAVFRARSLPDYRAAVDALFASGSFDAEAGFQQA